jgi:hypothetical protein
MFNLLNKALSDAQNNLFYLLQSAYRSHPYKDVYSQEFYAFFFYKKTLNKCKCYKQITISFRSVKH